jgi:pimeloyl-ACP methyl ester carboxylesterase
MLNEMARKKIHFKGKEVTYKDSGSGNCLVLLHGYLETGDIWNGFADRFMDSYRVILPDLPGHGQSGTWGNIHTMEDLAASVRVILEHEGTGKVFLVGHSMGGYVTMAFADLYPELLAGYCLFHSTCYADTEEKKKNRQREISLVRCGKKVQIINVNIPKGFANDRSESMNQEVERARRIALDAPDEGIVAILNGMIRRPDRTHVLQDPSLPKLLIGGMKDNYIPGEVFEKLVQLAPDATALRLEESGHMGFIEEPEEAAKVMSAVMRGIY